MGGDFKGFKISEETISNLKDPNSQEYYTNHYDAFSQVSHLNTWGKYKIYTGKINNKFKGWNFYTLSPDHNLRKFNCPKDFQPLKEWAENYFHPIYMNNICG